MRWSATKCNRYRFTASEKFLAPTSHRQHLIGSTLKKISPRHRDPTSLAYGGPSGRTKTGLTPRQVQRKNGDVVTTSLAAARQAARATVTVRDPTVYREAALLNAYDRSTN